MNYAVIKTPPFGVEFYFSNLRIRQNQRPFLWYLISVDLITVRKRSYEKVMFYTCLSFCPWGVSAPLHAGKLPWVDIPWVDTPWADTPSGHTPRLAHPPSRMLLLLMVRILLECILPIEYIL